MGCSANTTQLFTIIKIDLSLEGIATFVFHATFVVVWADWRSDSAREVALRYCKKNQHNRCIIQDATTLHISSTVDPKEVENRSAGSLLIGCFESPTLRLFRQLVAGVQDVFKQ